jgi:penicillin-binding protein 2
MRFKVLHFFILICFFLMAGSLFYLQIIRGDYFFNLSRNNRIRVVPLEGRRGRVFDRHGRLLADNREAFNVTVIPQDVEDQKLLFEEIGRILKIPAEQLERTYRARKHTPFVPVEIAGDVSREQAIILEEQRYRFPSLIIQESYRRSYPHGESGAHIIGYIGKTSPQEAERFQQYGYSPRKMTGKDGVERYYDTYLKGGDGGLQIEVNSRGQQVRLLGYRDPVPGVDISLTIDVDLQKVITGALGDKPGAVVIMDSVTGEILGMASLPDFDPNIFVDEALRDKRQRILISRQAPILNRATRGVYPPGSVFKIPVAIAGLDSKTITEHTTYTCQGFMEVGNTRFGCTHVHGPQNLNEAIAHSCNIYFYQLGLKLGADRMHDYAREMGLGVLTHVDLPFERPGLIPSRREYLNAKKEWYTGNSLNMSIGQGDVMATPLQLARMMATVARNGVEIQPRVILAIGGKPAIRGQYETKKKIRPEVWGAVRRGLRAAVTDYSGTAHVLDLPGMYVSGKTGTAQSSGDKDHHSWFAGYVTGPKRNLAFCVFLEHGGSSQNANLVARQILLTMRERQWL